jgi:hypothetical protein
MSGVSIIRPLCPAAQPASQPHRRRTCAVDKHDDHLAGRTQTERAQHLVLVALFPRALVLSVWHGARWVVGSTIRGVGSR